MTNIRGLSFGSKPRETTTTEFANSRAYMIGINAYQNGIPQLRTAVADAERLGKLLKESHRYTTLTLPRNGAPTLSTLRDLLHKKMLQEVGPNDRVLFYFAGHGIALDGDDGPEGFLVPEDANREDRSSFLSMTELNDALAKLPCRHLLLILDCCFAGAFRWSSTRDLSDLPSVIHRERYERYIQDPAWQVLTSAAYDQTALDVLSGITIGERIETADHSPFAAALFRALAGDADLIPRGKEGQPGGDGVITASELYLYLRECVETATIEHKTRQTPGLWPLRKHDKGEYILLSPGHELNLPPAPELNYDNNPYRGLKSFEEEHSHLFFGRTQEIEELRTLVSLQPLTVVLGASGTGKSSVVKAGLLPCLRLHDGEDWQILRTIRPGKSALATLASLTLPGEAIDTDDASRLAELWSDENAFTQRIKKWAEAEPGATRLLLNVDQFEELITLCWDKSERDCFIAQLASAVNACPDRFRLVITLRSDFEPQFFDCALKGKWMPSRYVVPAMSTDDLRDAIEGPASVRVLYFQPTELVDRLIDEVIQTPGAMPLLSFTLSELYVRYLERRGDDRCLTLADFEQLGGVAGSLRRRATELYDKLDDPHKATMQRIMLRMVSAQGGELSRRRVPKSELVYPRDVENERVSNILTGLSEARLVVEGKELDGDGYVEPAHDALVRGWDKLLAWTRREQEQLIMCRLLTPAANDWRANQGGTWRANPRLSLVNRIRQTEDSWLNATEASFVIRSVAIRRSIWLGMYSFLAVAFLVLSLTTYFAVTSAREANRQAANAFWQVATTAREQNQGVKAAFNYLLAAQNSNKAGDELQRHNNELAAQFAASGLLRSFPHDGNVLGVQVSRDNSRVLTWGADGLLKLWDITRIEPLKVWRHESPINGAVFSSDESRVLAWSGQAHMPFEVKLWDVSKTKPFRVWEGTEGAAFSHDKSQVLVWGGHSVKLWDITKSKPLREWNHSSEINGVKFSRDSTRVLSWSADGEVKLWDVTKTEPIQAWKHDNFVYGVVFSNDEARVLAWSSDGGMKLWDVTKPESIQAWKHNYGVNGGVFTNDDTRVLSWGSDGEVRLWDVTEPDPIKIWKLGRNSVDNATFTRDETRVLSWGSDGATVWDVKKVEPIPLWTDVASNRGAKFAQDETRVLSWGDDGAVKLWDVANNKLIHDWHHNDADANVMMAAFTDDDSRILSWGRDDHSLRPHDVKIWDATSAEPQQAWQLGSDVHRAVFNGDGDRVLAWSSDGFVKLWDVTKTEPLRTWKHDSKVIDAVFSRDETRVLAWSGDGAVKLWDVTKTEVIQDWKHSGTVRALFSPDESQVLAWSNWEDPVSFASGSELKLWDVTKAEPLQVWKDKGWLGGALLTRDASRILTWSNRLDLTTLKSEGEVKLLDVTKLIPLQIWKHNSRVHGAEFTRSESNAVSWGGEDTMGGDGTVKLWDPLNLDPLRIWEHNRFAAGVKFTRDESGSVSWSFESVGELRDVKNTNYLHRWLYQRLGTDAVYTGDVSRILTWSNASSPQPSSEVTLWDTSKFKPLQVWKHEQLVKAAVLSSDGALFLSFSSDAFIKLWGVTEAEPLQVWKHGSFVIGAAFSRDNSRVLVWSSDGALSLRNVTKVEPIQVWKSAAPIIGAVFSPDETHILTWHDGGGLKLWDTAMRDVELTPKERIKNLEVRSATRLDSSGQVVRLKWDEWLALARSPEYQAIQEKRKAADSSSISD